MITGVVLVEEVAFLLAGHAHLSVSAEAEHHTSRAGACFSEKSAGNAKSIRENMVAAKSALLLACSVAVLACRAIEKELFAESTWCRVCCVSARLAGGIGKVELIAGFAEELIVEASAGHAFVLKQACRVMLGALQTFSRLELEGSLAKLTSHFIGGLRAVRANASFEEVIRALKVAKIWRCELTGRTLSINEEESATFLALAGIGQIFAGQASLLVEVVSFAELAGVFSDCALTGLTNAVEEERVFTALTGCLASRSAALAYCKYKKADKDDVCVDFHSVLFKFEF